MYKALNVIDEKSAQFAALSDDIWGYAETAFLEFKSAEALCGALEKEGFEVERGIAGIETAFLGRFGSGKPVIGFLGEFDALFGMSQEAGAAQQKEGPTGNAGHGCGHNLLGVGSLAAAFAAKAYLEENPGAGTVIYYGCPGEEGGSGKAFMAREGVFAELDAALTWHPGMANTVSSGSSLANIQALFRFKGISAHAAANPETGRSALDAVELMNVGVNFLREHMPLDNRVHYAITNAGGLSPNVVQPQAEVLYLCRAPKNAGAQALYDWVCDIARGAALMTQTSVEIEFIKACSNVVVNQTLEALLQENLNAVPLPVYTDAQLAPAHAVRATTANCAGWYEQLEANGNEEAAAMLRAEDAAPVHQGVLPYVKSEKASPGSTDVGDVSWVCPTAQIGAATMVKMSPGHSWQIVSQGKSEVAHGATLYAAKVMARTAIDLFTQPETLAAAKAEHARRVPEGYTCPIPQGIKPRAISDKM